MKKKIEEILAQMTTQEKVEFLSGANDWLTKEFPHLGIPSVQMNDGPNGLRIEYDNDKDRSYPAVCYPAMSTVASSWDTEQFAVLAQMLAAEAKSQRVDVLLGPGVNIKRTPLCGRNFEYLSEDPLLSSRLAERYITELQQNGVGACIKHFACNNNERKRMVTDVRVSRRALRELYLKSFEGAVRRAKPCAVMSSYNLVNGVQMSDNKELLSDILREEWGFEGAVISDWGSVNNRAAGVRARMNLEMPCSQGKFDVDVHKALADGSLTMQQLDDCVADLLRFVFDCTARRAEQPDDFDYEAAHRTARDIARASIVLLKNNKGILPLPTTMRIAVVGDAAKRPRYQGGGSANVNPVLLENPLEELQKTFPMAGYSCGYSLDSDVLDEQEAEQAAALAKSSEVTLFFAALPDRCESEFFDRTDLRLPACQNELIERLTAHSRVVVVLCNGSAVEMPWLERVDAVLETYLLGQACGSVVCEVLTGAVNPSGKLTETFPKRLEDTPSYPDCMEDNNELRYNEDIYVGYRWYDLRRIEPLFPFGFGLSYTSFAYSGFCIDRRHCTQDGQIVARVTVQNTGAVQGSEVVQLYSANRTGRTGVALRELRDFAKVSLRPGESVELCFTLPVSALAVFSEQENDWVLHSGRYALLVGSSSRTFHGEEEFIVESDYSRTVGRNHNVTLGELLQNSTTAALAQELLDELHTGLTEEGVAPDCYERLGQSKLLSYPIRNLCDLTAREQGDRMEARIMAALEMME